MDVRKSIPGTMQPKLAIKLTLSRCLWTGLYRGSLCGIAHWIGVDKWFCAMALAESSIPSRWEPATCGPAIPPPSHLGGGHDPLVLAGLGWPDITSCSKAASSKTPLCMTNSSPYSSTDPHILFLEFLGLLISAWCVFRRRDG